MDTLSTPLFYNGNNVKTIDERRDTFINGNTVKILEEMFVFYDGRQTRKNTAFLKALTIALKSSEYPTFDDVWECTGKSYAETTKKQNRSWISRAGWTEDSMFGERFWNEYMQRWTTYTDKKREIVTLKKDCAMRHEYDVESEYDYDNTMDVIRENPHVIYRLPTINTGTLDYFDTCNIQIIKMNHVGGNPVVQMPLLFHYRCNKCQYEIDLPYDTKSVPCRGTECSGKMLRIKSRDTVRPVHASRVVTDDMNSISIISLAPIPQGEFIGAVFLCRNKTDYYLFMIATEEIEPTSTTVNIVSGGHAIWQIIKQIDEMHEERIGKHIHGMEWYKAAILLAYLANCKGRVSTNVMIIGDAGVGKTGTARIYIATLTQQQKVQDAMNLTGPGLHGSMTQIKIGDSVINVPEAGLLVRHKLVVIDEILENRNTLMPQLKTALVMNTISREVHGNRTQTPKYATAIVTSNRPPDVVNEQNRWMGKYMISNYGEVNDQSKAKAKEEMIEEWKLRGLEWGTGQTLADMDRYPLIFFVKDPDNEVKYHDLGGEDNEIDDLKLAKLLYDSDINEYFSFCGKITVDWKPHQDRIIKLVSELREHDKIHSKKRVGQNITLMLQLSAQINKRTNLIDEDFEFVRELWSKTCNWVDVSEMSRGSTCSMDEWDTKTIKCRINEHMNASTADHGYMSEEMLTQISDKLVSEGAPVGLVDSTVEHYRQNPNQ